MHSDSEVMADLGGPIDQSESYRKFERYRAAQREQGISRWAIEKSNGAFVGYAGVMPRLSKDHPLRMHFEVGWRLVRAAWGYGSLRKAPRQLSIMLFVMSDWMKLYRTQAPTTGDRRPSWLD